MKRIIKIDEKQLRSIIENVLREYDEEGRIEKMVDKYNKMRVDKRDVDGIMEKFDRMLDGYGIEAVRGHDYQDSYWGDILFLYVNMGDTYTKTVVYDTQMKRFVFSSWGDYYEENYPESDDTDEMEQEPDVDWERERGEDYEFQSGAPTPYD